jgi:hypothetical protein
VPLVTLELGKRTSSLTTVRNTKEVLIMRGIVLTLMMLVAVFGPTDLVFAEDSGVIGWWALSESEGSPIVFKILFLSNGVFASGWFDPFFIEEKKASKEKGTYAILGDSINLHIAESDKADRVGITFSVIFSTTESSVTLSNARELTLGYVDDEEVTLYGTATVRYSVAFPESGLSFSKEEGYDRVQVSGCMPMSYAGDAKSFGKPDLPFRGVHLIIPSGNKVASIHFDSKNVRKLDGTFKVYPQQPLIPICEGYEGPPFVEPDSIVYKSDDPYPPQLGEVTHVGDSGGNRVVSLAVHPLQYYPASGRLFFHTHISVSLVTTHGEQSTMIPAFRGPVSSEVVEHAFRNSVENPEKVDMFGYFPPLFPYPELGVNVVRSSSWGKIKSSHR